MAINQHPLISMLHISLLMTKSVASMKNVYKIDKKCKFKSNNLTGPVSKRINNALNSSVQPGKVFGFDQPPNLCQVTDFLSGVKKFEEDKLRLKLCQAQV